MTFRYDRDSSPEQRLAQLARRENGEMHKPVQKINPFLWFDNQAEAAVNFYVSIFENSKVTAKTYYGATGPGPKDSVMTVAFELAGQEFIALNGGRI